MEWVELGRGTHHRALLRRTHPDYARWHGPLQRGRRVGSLVVGVQEVETGGLTIHLFCPVGAPSHCPLDNYRDAADRSDRLAVGPARCRSRGNGCPQTAQRVDPGREANPHRPQVRTVNAPTSRLTYSLIAGATRGLITPGLHIGGVTEGMDSLNLFVVGLKATTTIRTRMNPAVVEDSIA